MSVYEMWNIKEATIDRKPIYGARDFSWDIASEVFEVTSGFLDLSLAGPVSGELAVVLKARDKEGVACYLRIAHQVDNFGVAKIENTNDKGTLITYRCKVDVDSLDIGFKPFE